jgi:hypothetical protein
MIMVSTWLLTNYFRWSALNFNQVDGQTGAACLDYATLRGLVLIIVQHNVSTVL